MGVTHVYNPQAKYIHTGNILEIQFEMNKKAKNIKVIPSSQ